MTVKEMKAFIDGLESYWIIEMDLGCNMSMPLDKTKLRAVLVETPLTRSQEKA